MTTVTHPANNNVERGICEATFDAETYTVSSLSAYDAPVADGKGQWPTILDQLDAEGVALTGEQRDVLAGVANPSWEPTYERITLGLDGTPIDADDPEAVAAATVEHEVADCPTCGTPIKVV